MRKFIAALGALFAVVVCGPGTSSAGGWVVVSFDAAPLVHAGEPADVGFTVLRHGVTPETSPDLEIVLTDPSGTEHRFAAVPQGAVGHHVAAIDVPLAGGYTWRVIGEFVAVDLGSLEVDSSAAGGSTWTWDAVQWGGLTLAVALAGVAARDVIRDRRHRISTAPVAA